MSEMELHTGTAIQVTRGEGSLGDKVAFVLRNYGIAPVDYEPDFGLVSYRDYGFVYAKGQIYRLEDTKHEAEGCCTAETNGGTEEITYVLHYYNGGCGFDEAFEAALKRLNS